MLNSEAVAYTAFQLDTSEQGYSPDPSSRVGSGVQTTTRLLSNLSRYNLLDIAYGSPVSDSHTHAVESLIMCESDHV